MFRIGEFSRIARVSARLLRFYDEIGLLTPAHADPQTGYRHYTVTQLAQLNRILVLKDLGFDLDQVRDPGDHPPDLGTVGQRVRLADAAEAEGTERAALLRLGADGGTDLGDAELRHHFTSVGSGAGPRWVSR